MDTLVERCAGLDVHQKSVTACVRTPDGLGGRRITTRTYKTTVRELVLLREWLASEGVTRVGMESTGVYWRPVFYALEDQMDCWLLNAEHLKHVPGRKTDMADAAWIAQLMEHGLVRPSFVPPPIVRQLRSLTRYRKALVEERTREAQRLTKVLEEAGIKLMAVVSTILGRSARLIVAALVDGERNPEVLADLARGRLRAKLPQLREALAGHFEDHHAFLAGLHLERIAQIDEHLTSLDHQIEQLLVEQQEAVELLDTIPGVNVRIAQIILGEVGFDMDRFGTPERLCSWAGLCPGNNESAGKHLSGRTRHGNATLRATLVEAAHAAANARGTALHARYHRIKARRGAKKAALAVAHHILTIAFFLLVRRKPYEELGEDYFLNRHRERRIAGLVRQLERLGQRVTVEPAA